jgi:hypothetical protein
MESGKVDEMSGETYFRHRVVQLKTKLSGNLRLLVMEERCEQQKPHERYLTDENHVSYETDADGKRWKITKKWKLTEERVEDK